ncbi:MAG TPA: Hsp20/alpha crystallin family protein [Syntrophorhabdaceae bacterium]|nr:Hsp20/alpha crystallin family protein [Syntrophorhabdaceae bacterium]
MADKNQDIQKQDEKVERIERARAAKIFNPDVDIMERKDDIIVIADMPGIDESSVDVTLENNVLNIYGKVDWNAPENLKLLHSEYGIGDYQRVFTLSGEVDREKIEATVNNGVLRIVLPKAEAIKTKKIAVSKS